jgi:hypothetical protein
LLPNIIRGIKSKRIIRAGVEAGMGWEGRREIQNFGRELEGNKLLQRLRHTWEANIKMYHPPPPKKKSGMRMWTMTG